MFNPLPSQPLTSKDFKQDTDGDSSCNEQVSRADSKECRNDGLASHIDAQVKDTWRLAAGKCCALSHDTWATLPGRWPLDTLGLHGKCMKM